MSEIKYKGIDTEKIKEVQRVEFPHVAIEPLRINLPKFHDLDKEIVTATQIELQNRIDELQQKRNEDRDFYVICEMAKLYLEQCEALKRIVERLKNRKADYEKDYKEYLDGEDLRKAMLLDVAIEIVQEEGGLNENT